MPKQTDQGELGIQTGTDKTGPVECLGKTFENDDARREYYLEELRKKLQDPEFRKIEGFPIGEDEDILALSDPPYYTACPNPWLADFVKHYGKPYAKNDKYHREPFAADVTEGKTDPIYTAHSYHAKVPYKAVMRFILHYTEPGDLIFDGFCGTGMTAVAAQMCGNKHVLSSMGYRITDDNILVGESGTNVSTIGPRRAFISDLSPVASFIAHNYNTPLDTKILLREGRRVLDSVEDECGWMYETLHSDGKTKGRINYTVWSEVFACAECGGQIVFVREAFDQISHTVRKEVKCPDCSAISTKEKLTLIHESIFDPALEKTVQRPRRVPVLINYNIGNSKHEKIPDSQDVELLIRIEEMPLPPEIPTTVLPEMQMARVGRMQTTKTTHLHRFFLLRPALSLASLWRHVQECSDTRLRHALMFLVEQAIWGMSILNRYQPIMHGRPGGSQVNRALSGVFYVPSQISEVSPWYNLESKLGRIVKSFSAIPSRLENTMQWVGPCQKSGMSSNSVDYIFTDPPFGENIYYADLNMLIESWYRVLTNTAPEAIVDRVRGKNISDYQGMMLACFKEYFRVLKPGRWITVEFSNTSASVWNTIQAGLQEAGFVVANVARLNKKQGSFQAVTSPTAMKEDLVISAYKPNGGLENRFAKIAECEAGVWEFVTTHLGNLPTAKIKSGQLQPIPERDSRSLYSRTVAFYLRHGIPVPISAPEFQSELFDKFPERDGMYFLPQQAVEYDSKRMQVEGLGQLSIFVEDERTAVDWLRQFLKNKPSKYQDITPNFLQALADSWKKWETRPELRALLDQYFLCYAGEGNVPPQIHGYLSTDFKELRNLNANDSILKAKALDRWYVPDPKRLADVERVREKRLLEEFWTYMPPGMDVQRFKHFHDDSSLQLPGMEPDLPNIPKGKRLKIVRTEAVRVGFTHCSQMKNYLPIVAVARYIPEDVVSNDDQLQMIVDLAEMRLGL